MRKTFGSLYMSLQAGLLACRELEPEQQIEISFQVAEHYCKELFHLAEDGLTDTEDEIEFFRNVKPKFIAELLYWQLVNHFFLFCNPADEEFSELVCREKGRLADFIVHNRSFCDYYSSGSRDLDKRYFTEKDERIKYLLPLFYGGRQRSSGYDLVLGSLLALERYDAFVERIVGKRES